MIRKRRAIVRLSQQDLEQLLDLPEGLSIIGVHDDWTRFGISVLVEGDQLDETDEHTEPPTLIGTWTRNPLTLRFQWRRDMSPERA